VFGTGNVSFEMADFGSDEVFFERVNFGSGNVSFLNVIFNNLSFKESHLNNYLDLRVNKGNKVDLSDTIVRDIIDFKPVKSPVDIEELNITGMRNLGAIFIGWNENGVYNLIANQPDTSLREKANQFNILKEDYNSTGQYGDEDRAYVAFKRFELKADLEESVKESPLNVFWIYPLSFVKWLVADKIGLYATNPLRVLISMSVVYVLFSLLYTIMPEFMHSDVICSGADNDKFPYWALAFYFSAITFLTIGYGDCLPEGHIKWIAPIEGWMGMFLLAYFTVAFMRKILR
ncbi:two pore domain potassium channel family protein, partial [Bacteroidales bacterium AH-315-I05]|nr:two pore domain potassium channel family protein [Bacteroidales bacterium AH-315-I05]